MTSYHITSLPPGFDDHDPSTTARKEYLVQSFFQHCALYGFHSIDVSPLSFSTTFLKQNAEAREWVYTFEDKGGRELILNPDSLPAVLRCFVNHANSSISSVRWSFCAPIFRYKRQKQRYYHHLGAAIINETSSYFGELIVDLIMSFLLNEFSRDFCIKINNFDLWLDLFRLHDISEDAARDILYVTNSMNMEQRLSYIRTTLGKEVLQDLLQNLAVIGSTTLTSEMQDRLEAILPASLHHHVEALWTYAKVRQREKERLSIILDLHDFHAGSFHDGIAFQIFADPNLPRIGDGGSYHTYSQHFHPSSVYKVNSTVLRLEDVAQLYTDERFEKKIKLFLYIMLPNQSAFIDLIASLRKSGISIWEDMTAKTVGGALKRAVHMNAVYFAVLGEKELETSTIEVKHLASRRKYHVSWNEILQTIE